MIIKMIVPLRGRRDKRNKFIYGNEICNGFSSSTLMSMYLLMNPSPLFVFVLIGNSLVYIARGID